MAESHEDKKEGRRAKKGLHLRLRLRLPFLPAVLPRRLQLMPVPVRTDE